MDLTIRITTAQSKIRNYASSPPRQHFAATLPFDQAVVHTLGETTINPFATMYDAGVGATLMNKKLNVALDFADMGNRGNSQEARLGADYDIAKGFAVQCGYSSLNGWAAGVSVFGFNLAVSNRNSLQPL